MKYIRSILFNLFYFIWTFCLSFIGCLTAPLPRKAIMGIAKFWSVTTMKAMEVLIGLKYRVEGIENLPENSAFIIASKHQSAFETIAYHAIFPHPVFVLKKELLWLPLFGWNLLLTGCIPIDRSSGMKAMRSILEGAQKRLKEGYPVVIFPEGTRTAPGTTVKYNPGVGLLYEQCNVPVIPVVLNSGEFWKRKAFVKQPGTITVKILPPMPKGLQKREFIDRLQNEIENAYKTLKH